MAHTLTKLTNALRDRDDVRRSIRKLEADVASSPDSDSKARSKLEKETKHLSSTDGTVEEVRQQVAAEMAACRSRAEEAEATLKELEARRVSGDLSEQRYDREVARAQRRIAVFTGRASLRERALEAERAKDLAWLATAPAEHLEAEGDPEQSSHDSRFSDFTGATVPERIMMLVRESRKPQSKKAIVYSAIVLSILTVAIIGAVLVSARENPKDATDFLGQGDFLVPVIVQDAEFVRSLEFTLQYDSELIQGVSVMQGDVGRLAYMQYDVDHDGAIEVQVRDVLGIAGSGNIIIVRFHTDEILSDPVPIAFSSISAQDVRTMEAMQTEGVDGWVNTESLEVLPPVIEFPEA